MVELHKKLIPSYNEDYYSYFKEGWQLVYSTDADSTEFVFSPEDEFIYLFVHFTKHYRDGGIGLIHLTDIYLFLQSNKIINKEYIETVLDDLHILEFYKNIILTIEMCFEYGQESYISNHIIDVIFNSGSYGTFESQTLSTVVKKTRGVKRKKSIRIVYLMKRVFMPYKEMCARHVLLKKIPFLLPFFWLYRVFSVCLFKRENIQKEITKLNISKSDQVLAYYDSLKLVGLDFYFKD